MALEYFIKCPTPCLRLNRNGISQKDSNIEECLLLIIFWLHVGIGIQWHAFLLRTVVCVNALFD